MKTKDEGTAWLRSHGWILCERGWVRALPTPSRRSRFGRPLSEMPADFVPMFIEHGWEAKDLLGMATARFKRLLVQAGADELKRQRLEYRRRRRLSSLKVRANGV